MFKTFQNALKVKEVRQKLLFTLFILVIVRLGSGIPVPGTDSSYIATLLAGLKDNMGFLNAITGGSFEKFSVFALGINPYITSSIIMQLLTIAIPKLEEMQKDGEEGRKKIAEFTRYLTVILALIQSVAMAIGFGNKGLIDNYGAMSIFGKICAVAAVVIVLTAGSAVLMWLGERITEKGIGNGISIILVINILSRIPNDLYSLYEAFMQGQSIAMQVFAALVIAAIIIGVVVLTIILQDGVHKIPVQYAKKMQGRKMVGGNSSFIPLKVNTAGVIPVIFASSILSLPAIFASFFTIKSTFWNHILAGMSSSNWFRASAPWYSIGLIVYLAMIIVFAYFYTSITFNPVEIANNMKKQGGFIPGIRPGKPTSDYLNKILNYIVFIGAGFLAVIAVIPIFFAGVFSIQQVSFGGTSIIIIVGVALETIKQVESQMLVRNYKGFLND
ncbi:preprotein translocase subunit SecY [Cuneatibacter caecimuris]|uniref:Protein translocase subunit SecY n=1 Tax=Cuneatibacter caecimuris TaxID=1796618 RepID=A0A4Q7PQE1_9FIRM|nr:preprotein translocase subunit SecY [Cuneatibacter caecimuris]RZT02735.1 protein translocase subunit secY/sec61 alpha [Cuneatibacter caecimuris]